VKGLRNFSQARIKTVGIMLKFRRREASSEKEDGAVDVGHQYLGFAEPIRPELIPVRE
jgi:hypothetical protein